MNKLDKLILKGVERVIEKKLCPKGKKYYDRRIKAGEKPSAYLSGRAKKVCMGSIKLDETDCGCGDKKHTNSSGIKVIHESKKNFQRG